MLKIVDQQREINRIISCQFAKQRWLRDESIGATCRFKTSIVIEWTLAVCDRLANHAIDLCRWLDVMHTIYLAQRFDRQLTGSAFLARIQSAKGQEPAILRCQDTRHQTPFAHANDYRRLCAAALMDASVVRDGREHTYLFVVQGLSAIDGIP